MSYKLDWYDYDGIVSYEAIEIQQQQDEQEKATQQKQVAFFIA